MAKLTARRRRNLRASQFAVGRRRGDPKSVKGHYPIDTANRARNALARVAQHGTASEKAQVRAAVRRKWPSIAVGGRKTRRRK